MRARDDAFLEIFRASSPLVSEAFRVLCDKVGATADAKLLQDFLAALNRDLARRVDSGAEGDVTWAVDLCAALATSSPEATVGALGALVNDGVLWFHDPVVAVAFEAASQAPALLELLADLVDSESHLLQFRVRAVEALVTRLPDSVDTDAIGLEAQSALRFLNAIFEEIARGPARAGADACARWAEGFAGLSRLFPETEGGPEVLAWVAAAVAGLGEAPTAPETMRTVLRILRSNTPLPPWRPRPRRAARDGGRSDAVSALIVDKAIQVVLATSGTRWRSSAPAAPPRLGRQGVELWPFNEPVLSAALLDQTKPPRARVAAAGLLVLLGEASPSVAPSTCASVYAEILLASHRPAGGDRDDAAEPRPDSEERLDCLLDAASDACRPIRYAAIERCRRFAERHPTWFVPRHYTKLLPLLSDDDPQVRAGAMKTFQALAGFRSRQVATVVGNIAARIHGHGADTDLEEEAQTRRNLEIALGITMDRLVDDVEHLQKEVQLLEARRGELLQYIETQAIRVGEEIHHEVLNTLTGYLATAIDEGNYAEARGWLEALIQELRRIMNNLYPRDLETEGFLQTIRNRLRYAKGHLERRGQRCDVALDCPPEITDAAIEATAGGPSHVVLLYRIVLEAISNARKHSHGTRIAVSLTAPEPGAIEIRIADNGAAPGGPFVENAGMALMRRRAEEIGAVIEYQATTPAGGTTVLIRLPGVAGRDDGGGRLPNEAAGQEVEGDGEARPAT